MAVFAGGCFWCTEADFDKKTGVLLTLSGYIAGDAQTANYEAVSSGKTDHIEAVAVFYDPAQIDFKSLVDYYWLTVDPLDAGGQFCDRGAQYRTALFYGNEQEKQIIEQSRENVAATDRLDKPIVTDLLPKTAFYPAEEYHQDYYQKNPLRYRYYRTTCGRDARLDELWGAQRQ
ncbi:peptide-methionine (S)-S-oxide reductase MsrA [Halopseudomonas salina]|uniref:Peptide methionine sulfoxide reductase MsrA n=1 Tax=Halopseudomonas salina TaxID=1323744 RepID=A0ABQ1P0U4_9GAMM|nr:peptide-methionine (S)-S-oxide reductase MsrA [Halopseudomonas salina]GGC88484.1 peptide methionine sulfoxide reductase MsrA [Halopseudomonas salina]